jgi:hypothetical protein
MTRWIEGIAESSGTFSTVADCRLCSAMVDVELYQSIKLHVMRWVRLEYVRL